MPKFMIERDIPGVGSLSREELQAMSQRTCAALESLGPKIQWIQSYVTDDKVYCVYIAPDEATIREHAAKGGFSACSISAVQTMLDPTSSE